MAGSNNAVEVQSGKYMLTDSRPDLQTEQEGDASDHRLVYF